MTILSVIVLVSVAIISGCVLYLIGEERGEDAMLYGVTGLLLGPLALLMLWFPTADESTGRTEIDTGDADE